MLQHPTALARCCNMCCNSLFSPQLLAGCCNTLPQATGPHGPLGAPTWVPPNQAVAHKWPAAQVWPAAHGLGHWVHCMAHLQLGQACHGPRCCGVLLCVAIACPTKAAIAAKSCGTHSPGTWVPHGRTTPVRAPLNLHTGPACNLDVFAQMPCVGQRNARQLCGTRMHAGRGALLCAAHDPRPNAQTARPQLVGFDAPARGLGMNL